MKTYKKVEVEAVNAPSGSYAAGCPQYRSGTGIEVDFGPEHPYSACKYCECSR